jgi:hypothetical protein
MESRHQARWGTIRYGVLLLALGLAACAGPPVAPGNQGWARVEPRSATPDRERATRCEQHFKEAVRVCDDLYNSPDSDHYRDDAWRQKCLEQAKEQYESCLTYGGR